MGLELGLELGLTKTIEDAKTTHENNGLIYKATNLKTGREYIGLTSRTLEERKQEHYYLALTKSRDFYRDLLSNDFKWEVLESGIPLEDLLKVESMYISKGTNLYNRTKGSNKVYTIKPVEEPEIKYGKKDITPKLKEDIIKLHKTRISMTEISRRTKVCRRVISDILLESGIRVESGSILYTYEDALKVLGYIKENIYNITTICNLTNFSRDFVYGVLKNEYYSLVSEELYELYTTTPKHSFLEESNRKAVSSEESIEVLKYIYDTYGLLTGEEISKELKSKGYDISRVLIVAIANRRGWEGTWNYLETSGYSYDLFKTLVKDRRELKRREYFKEKYGNENVHKDIKELLLKGKYTITGISKVLGVNYKVVNTEYQLLIKEGIIKEEEFKNTYKVKLPKGLRVKTGEESIEEYLLYLELREENRLETLKYINSSSKPIDELSKELGLSINHLYCIKRKDGWLKEWDLLEKGL